jgi:hypothetical protein
MVEGQKRRVESIKQHVQDIALNVRDRFNERVSGKARNLRYLEKPVYSTHLILKP